MTRESITCPRCGRTSWHPEDVRQGYCGACHEWTSTPRCPWCSSLPVLVLGGGTQAFCGNDACGCFTWNSRKSIKELMAEVGLIELPPGFGDPPLR